jgi:DNA processing protein
MSEDLPQRLNDIEKVPKMIYAYGNAELLHEKKIIAIVGSRRPTDYGLRQARRFALELAQTGFVIVSGFAIGIDTQAHQGAIEGGGSTIAVIGCGIGIDYPKSNRQLKECLLTNHLIITEHPVHTMPSSENFPYRNRLISGLSIGIIVVESLIKSGTYWTVYHGLAQGKAIFAIPGSVESKMSQGPNQLIKTGAIPVTSPRDVLDYYSLFQNSTSF